MKINTICLSICLLSFFLIGLVSCVNKNTKKQVEIETLNTTDTLTFVNDTEEEEWTEEDSESFFPIKGTTESDFLPDSNIYEIQYATKGDLNSDGLADMALVLKNKTNNQDKRPMLIVLQNNDKNFRLDKVSLLVFPIEYNEADYKIYDTEDISIENGELSSNFYGIGPSGNLTSKFKYIENNLVLTYIEAFNMGAGSHQALYYDILKGELNKVVTNTMEEEMETSSKTYHLKKELFLFEQTSPDEVLIEAYKTIEFE